MISNDICGLLIGTKKNDTQKDVAYFLKVLKSNSLIIPRNLFQKRLNHNSCSIKS